MRSFFGYSGPTVVISVVLGLLFYLPVQAQPVNLLEETGREIVGYADRLSLEAGETITFKVSSRAPTYQAELVRLIHGDTDPDSPPFKSEPIAASLNGSHSGEVQYHDMGSYVRVPDAPGLRLNGRFTIQAWVYPTTPAAGRQGLITKWSASGSAWGLFLDESGALSFQYRTADGQQKSVSTNRPLRTPTPIKRSFQANNWYFVAVVVDSETGDVTLYQEPQTNWPGDTTDVIVTGRLDGSLETNNNALVMAGYQMSTGRRGTYVDGNFNGKIDGPHIYNRPLGGEEIDRLRTGQALDNSLVAAWDFAQAMGSDRAVDVAGRDLHGDIEQLPTRAVTGHDWEGKVLNYQRDRDPYNAIYFHEDDLERANWSESLRYTVPDDLESGIYAVHIWTDNDEDYVPFFVRPAPDHEKAAVAFLAPTLTYLAYANSAGECPVCPNTPSLGLYRLHSDGSGVRYSTRLRPILNMRPKVASNYGPEDDTPRHFNGDLNLVDWLEVKGIDYDVVTDHDLHQEGRSLLADYNVVITGSHPEYMTARMRRALEGYLDNGGRLMYLGGNGFYWVTSIPNERPHIIEVRKWGGTQTYATAPGEYYHSTTGEMGGLWRKRGHPPQELVGVGFSAQGYGGTHTWEQNRPYKRQPAHDHPAVSFILDGLNDGEMIGVFDSRRLGFGAAGDELDRVDRGLGTPFHAKIIARANDFPGSYQLVVEEVLQTSPTLAGPNNELVRADMVYFRYPNQGAVFSVGSLSWMMGLSYNDYSNSVSRITENVLRAFMRDGPLPPEGGEQ